jgi:hypothetical protein
VSSLELTGAWIVSSVYVTPSPSSFRSMILVVIGGKQNNA